VSRFSVEATRYQTPDPATLDTGRVVIAVEDGEIVAVAAAESDTARELRTGSPHHLELADTTVLVPGFVDLHVHAPQWQQLGTALDLPVQDWLATYTFPLEARFADTAMAVTVYTDLVDTLLAHGTTTAVYFASVHEPATEILAHTCTAAGQRALVGRVAMDHPDSTPTWYRDRDAAAGLTASASSIDAVRAADDGRGLVHPVITPRFLPACTTDLLTGLGELAADTGVRVQTNCSESDWHHAHALDRFGCTDTAALDRFGLLRDHTVLAHANHVTTADLALIADRGGAIAHCPISNAYFANAVLPVPAVLAAGARIGLGTDIGAGVRPGVLQQCHEAVTMSRLRRDGVHPDLPAAERGRADAAIDTVTAFWLATAGGASGIGLPVGLLEPGYRFDAVAIDLDHPGGVIRRLDDLDDDHRTFEKVVRLAQRSDIRQVWVDGETVHRR